MTVMGVHVNGGGSGGVDTSIGDTLAKALFGDPEREMKLALARQQYDSEAWKRRLWDAQVQSEQAQAANAAADAANREYQTRARQEAAPVIAEQQAGLLEPPAPVELSPATTRYDLPPDAPAIVADDPYSIYAAGQSVAPPLPGGMNLPVATAGDLGTLQQGDLSQPPTISPHAGLTVGQPSAADPYGRSLAGDLAGVQIPPQDPRMSPQTPDISMPVPVEVPAVTGVRPEDQAAYDRNVAAIKARVTAAMAMGQSATDIAKGMGISEGEVRMLSSDPEQQELGKSLYGDTRPAAAAGPGASPYLKGELEMRKQIEGLDAYKKLSAVVPVYLSMVKSAGGPLDPAALMDLVYGLATAEDPGSVVREGDSIQVKRIGGLSGELQGIIGYITGGNPIDASTVTKIMRIAKNRVGSYNQAYEHQAKDYRDIATRSGYDVRNAVPTFPDLSADVQLQQDPGQPQPLDVNPDTGKPWVAYQGKNPTITRDAGGQIIVDSSNMSPEEYAAWAQLNGE